MLILVTLNFLSVVSVSFIVARRRISLIIVFSQKIASPFISTLAPRTLLISISLLTLIVISFIASLILSFGRMLYMKMSVL